MVVIQQVLVLELKTPADWTALNYAAGLDCSLESVKDNVERIDASLVSHQDFVECYERPYKPVVLLNAQRDWNAVKSWTVEVGNRVYIAAGSCARVFRLID